MFLGRTARGSQQSLREQLPGLCETPTRGTGKVRATRLVTWTVIKQEKPDPKGPVRFCKPPYRSGHGGPSRGDHGHVGGVRAKTMPLSGHSGDPEGLAHRLLDPARAGALETLPHVLWGLGTVHIHSSNHQVQPPSLAEPAPPPSWHSPGGCPVTAQASGRALRSVHQDIFFSPHPQMACMQPKGRDWLLTV